VEGAGRRDGRRSDRRRGVVSAERRWGLTARDVRQSIYTQITDNPQTSHGQSTGAPPIGRPRPLLP
jgi:hypothetical protein